MKHLDILHDPSRTGDAVADARARHDTPSFRAAVAAAAARFAAAGIGRYLVLVDRKKDLVIRGGENISPSEIEAVLQAHPSVAQAAVVGRPDPVMGEEPDAFVIPTPGATIDEAEVLAYCRDVLARFKVPRAIHAVDTLPRNAIGKVTKDVLRRRLSVS